MAFSIGMFQSVRFSKWLLTFDTPSFIGNLESVEFALFISMISNYIAPTALLENGG